MQKTLLQVEAITSHLLIDEMAKQVEKIIDAKLNKIYRNPQEDRFITRTDVADMFQVSLPTIHGWMNKGILKPHKIGNKTRFLLSEVKAAAIYSGKREVPNV